MVTSFVLRPVALAAGILAGGGACWQGASSRAVLVGCRILACGGFTGCPPGCRERSTMAGEPWERLVGPPARAGPTVGSRGLLQEDQRASVMEAKVMENRSRVEIRGRASAPAASNSDALLIRFEYPSEITGPAGEPLIDGVVEGVQSELRVSYGYRCLGYDPLHPPPSPPPPH